jgi:hypothetical protein
MSRMPPCHWLQIAAPVATEGDPLSITSWRREDAGRRPSEIKQSQRPHPEGDFGGTLIIHSHKNNHNILHLLLMQSRYRTLHGCLWAKRFESSTYFCTGPAGVPPIWLRLHAFVVAGASSLDRTSTNVKSSERVVMFGLTAGDARSKATLPPARTSLAVLWGLCVPLLSRLHLQPCHDCLQRGKDTTRLCTRIQRIQAHSNSAASPISSSSSLA